MKAVCPDCGKRTSIDVSLLGENELAHHFECLPDEPLDLDRVARMLARAQRKTDVEVHDGEGKPPSAPSRKIPVVTSDQLAITTTTSGLREDRTA